MNTLYIVIFFITGLAFGSFYNVLGNRLSKNESIIKPRSHCEKCNHELKWYELIPVISYIFLKGKCKNCKTKLSIMYPLTEIFTGILFALSFYVFGFNIELILSILISSIFIIVLVSDLGYYIIPDSIIIAFGILIFIYNILSKGILNACTYTLYGLIMFIFMYALMLLGNFLFKKESLGGGDIKLMGILGMTTYPLLSFLSLSTGAVLALPISGYFAIKYKDKVIPFGPFIVAGFLIMFFTHLTPQEVITLFTFK